MTDCPTNSFGMNDCAWNLINAAEHRGIDITVSAEAPADAHLAVRVTCPHGNSYWIAPTLGGPSGVNVPGLNMEVEPRADIEARIAAGERAYYGVMRCNDVPAVRFPEPLRSRVTIVACTNCIEPCWLDPDAYFEGATIRCLQCLQAHGGELQARAIRQAAEEVRRLRRESE